MSIGAGILLFVIGAVLRFALNVEVSWIDLPFVGNLLMGAGALVFVLGLVFTFRSRRTVSTQRTVSGRDDVDGTTRTTRTVDDKEI
ncbi:MAG: DUF6458 family protein [Micrococcaceae bacterium]|nr:DUF6458 family protein [Micrococcaceae bacterium]